ncbi:MAG: hypothetical protein O7G85_12330, partial [Planctomycetota bacterium]|nr:hypothetical protein [Planctomycetota bacterium]
MKLPIQSIICLLIGAIVTVLVAWACAFWSTKNGVSFNLETIKPFVGKMETPGSGIDAYFAYTSHGFGVHLTNISNYISFTYPSSKKTPEI